MPPKFDTDKFKLPDMNKIKSEAKKVAQEAKKAAHNVSVAAANATAPAKYCSGCGAKLKADDQFCSQSGQKCQ